MAYPLDEVDLSKLEKHLKKRGCINSENKATNEDVGGAYMVFVKEYEGLKIDSIKKEKVLRELRKELVGNKAKLDKEINKGYILKEEKNNLDLMCKKYLMKINQQKAKLDEQEAKIDEVVEVFRVKGLESVDTIESLEKGSGRGQKEW